MIKIEIKGDIISNDLKSYYNEIGYDYTSPSDIVLPENNEDLEVLINSGGGDVFAGSEIYTMLKAYKGNVTVKIVGVAASAASVIAMAGDTVEISPTAQMMIHNVSTYAHGDHNTMKHTADTLEKFNKSISNAYRIKTGLSQNELLELMNNETWFDAQNAVKYGFADKIMFIDKMTVLNYKGDATFYNRINKKFKKTNQKVSKKNKFEFNTERLIRDFSNIAMLADLESRHIFYQNEKKARLKND